MKTLMLALTSTALIAAPAFAQAGAAMSQTGSSQPGSYQSGASQPASSQPGSSQPGSLQSSMGTTAAKPNVTVGANVVDTSGAAVGTIASVSGANAVVSTGTAKASIPVSSFAAGDKGLVIGMTKTDLEAAVSKASKPTDIAVGASVSDQNGGAVGKVAAVSGDMVTVATANSKAQLPKNAFAQGPSGLVIAMTASQLEAAAKAAGGGNSGT